MKMDEQQGMGGADFPYTYAGQKDEPTKRACGACDDVRSGQVDALSVRRFSTGGIRFVQVAGVLTAAVQTVKLFAKGTGEPGDASGIDGALTEADTDAFSEGALVTGANESFRAVALSFSFGAPYKRDTTGATREMPAWLEGYRADMQLRAMEDIAVSIEHGESSTPYRLGCIGMFPAQSGAASSPTFAQVGTPMAGALIPLRAVLKGGAKSSSERVRVVLSLPRSITLGVRGPAADADAVLPIRAELIGYVVSNAATAEVIEQAERSAMRQLNARLDANERAMANIADTLAKLSNKL